MVAVLDCGSPGNRRRRPRNCGTYPTASICAASDVAEDVKALGLNREYICDNSIRFIRKSTDSSPKTYQKEKMRQNKLPPGWNEERVQRVLTHYESQTDEEAVAEDEAAYEDSGDTLMEIPYKLVPIVRDLIAQTSSAEHVKS
jgi:hypothetical protein